MADSGAFYRQHHGTTEVHIEDPRTTPVHTSCLASNGKTPSTVHPGADYWTLSLVSEHRQREANSGRTGRTMTSPATCLPPPARKQQAAFAQRPTGTASIITTRSAPGHPIVLLARKAVPERPAWSNYLANIGLSSQPTHRVFIAVDYARLGPSDTTPRTRHWLGPPPSLGPGGTLLDPAGDRPGPR